MVDEAKTSGANIVIGSRFCSQKKPFSARMVGSALITAMIRLTTGRKIQDPTSGMRLFDTTMIPLFAEESDFGPEPDTVSLLMRRGAKVTEVQVEMRDRIAGESFLAQLHQIRFLHDAHEHLLFCSSSGSGGRSEPSVYGGVDRRRRGVVRVHAEEDSQVGNQHRRFDVLVSAP